MLGHGFKFPFPIDGRRGVEVIVCIIKPCQAQSLNESRSQLPCHLARTEVISVMIRSLAVAHLNRHRLPASSIDYAWCLPSDLTYRCLKYLGNISVVKSCHGLRFIDSKIPRPFESARIMLWLISLFVISIGIVYRVSTGKPVSRDGKGIRCVV